MLQTSNFKFFNKGGFTIVEIVVSLSILSIVLLAIMSFIFWTKYYNEKTKSDREVIENSRRSMDAILNEIRDARSVYTPTTTGGQLSLETVKYLPGGESKSYIDFFVCETNICLKKESQSPIVLNSESVEVVSIIFTQLAGATASIKVDMTMRYKNTDTSTGNFASINLSSSAVLRNYDVTFTPLPPPPSSSVAVDNVVISPDLSMQTSGVWTHTTNGTDKYLVVGLGGKSTNSSLSAVNVTYAGSPMTKIGSLEQVGQKNTVLWGLVNPPSGPNTVVVSNIPAGYPELGGGSISFNNVNQTNPMGFLISELNGDGAVNLVLSSNDMGVDLLYSGLWSDEPVIGVGGTKRVNMHLACCFGARWIMMGTEIGNGPTILSWTDNGNDFAQIAIQIKSVSSP